jgi:hypothetical protein
MSGFLSRVAARAVRQSPLIEPRLRSRFEPEARADAATLVDVESFVDGSRPSAGAAPPRAAKPPGTAATSVSSRLRLEAEPTSGIPSAREAPALAQERYPEQAQEPEIGEVAAAPALLPQNRDERPEAVVEVRKPDTRASRGAASRVWPIGVTPDEPADPEVAGVLAAADETGRSVPEARLVGPSESSPARAAAPGPASPSLAGHLGRVAAHLATVGSGPPRAAARRRPDGGERGETEEPVVHIRIGRIDVRAVAPTTWKPRAAAPGQPIESLDEYLKKSSNRR